MDIILIIIQSIVFFISGIFCIHLLRNNVQHKAQIITFVLIVNGLLFHIFLWNPIQNNHYLFFTLFPCSVAFPYTYFLFSKIYFLDEQFPLYKTIIILAAVYAVNLGLYLLSFLEVFRFLAIIAYIISFAILFLASFFVLKDFKQDLIDSRRKTRAIITLVNGLIGILLIFSFSTNDPLQLPAPLTLMTLIGQIILIISLFEIKINFINPNTIHKKTVERSESKIKKKNNLIINKIKELLEQKIYREEGLTITRLSSSIQTKEYLVRKAINEELGYANFNQFLNYYRIEEAKELLEKAPEMTMKEIAYHLGFANPSAFNRAFKNKMQKTPSEYKKSL